MRNYLNHAEKQDVLTIHATHTTVDRLATSTQAPKRVVGDLKRAKYFLKRALNTWTEEVDTKTLVQLQKQSGMMMVAIVNNTAAKATRKEFYRYQKAVREEAYVEHGRDPIYDMAADILDHRCKTCDGKCRETCIFYQHFQTFEVEPWNANHEHCVYAGTGSDH